MRAGIAGGGIMGLLTAFHLINDGWEVDLFDLSESLNCSHAAAGLLTPVAELEKGDALIYTMGLLSLQAGWPAILAALPENIYFKREGSLLLAHPRDRQELQRFANVIASRLHQPAWIKKLNQNEIGMLEPDLLHFSEAYLLQAEGQIDNQHVMSALMIYLRSSGMRYHSSSFVKHTAPHQIFVNDKIYQFDCVIDCRGLGGRQHYSTLRSLRGELLWVEMKSVDIKRPLRFLHPRYGLYIVPRGLSENNLFTYLIGASEIESEDYSAISVRTMLELLTAANCVHPGFLEARIIKTITQCRPALIHHRPQIQCSQGLVAVNGLYRHGFLLAPMLAKMVVDWITSNKINQDYAEIWQEAV